MNRVIYDVSRKPPAAIESYSVQTLAQRLANRLLMLAADHSVPTAAGRRIELRLSQETLARLIGATRQCVAQILKAWEHDGIVKQQLGRIVLLKQARLEAFARL